MKGNENTARRSHPNLPPDGKGLTVAVRSRQSQANPHFKDFAPLVHRMRPRGCSSSRHTGRAWGLNLHPDRLANDC